MDHAVAQHHRLQPTTTSHTLTTSPNRPNRSAQEKLGKPANTCCPQPEVQKKPAPTHPAALPTHPAALSPPIEAKRHRVTTLHAAAGAQIALHPTNEYDRP